VPPPHRTVTHRLSTGLIAALCVGAFVALLTGESKPAGVGVELIGSGAFLTGFVSHLAADDTLPSVRQRLLESVDGE